MTLSSSKENKYIIQVDVDLKPFIKKFLINKKNKLKELKVHIKNKNYYEIDNIAHNFKGTGTSYGFDFITESGIKIREFCENEEDDNIKSIVLDLEDYLNKIKIKYIVQD
ncbi:MAG: hypothetical protein ACQESP_11390 [Candidatus Muiribacteriota bacterium]